MKKAHSLLAAGVIQRRVLAHADPATERPFGRGSDGMSAD